MRGASTHKQKFFDIVSDQDRSAFMREKKKHLKKIIHLSNVAF